MTRNRSGQAVIESLIAVTVLVVGFIGITDLLTRSLSLYRVTIDNYTATYLASEGVELVKNLVDAGQIQNFQWGTAVPPGAYELDYASTLASLTPYSGRRMVFDPDSKLYSYGFGNETAFRRRIVVENVTEDEIKVNAIVDWTSRGGAQFSTNVEAHFFDWRGAP